GRATARRRGAPGGTARRGRGAVRAMAPSSDRGRPARTPARTRVKLISSPFHDRRSQRHAVAARARMRTAHAVAEDATIANISAEGCCVEFRGTTLTQGAFVVLRI